MNRKWIYLIATIFLLLLLLGGVPKFLNKRRIDSRASDHLLPRVSAMIVQKNLKPVHLTLPSSAMAWHNTPIWSRVNGYLIRYLVDIGDRVKKGDLLAEIDTPETDEQVAQAKADLENSIAERDIAKLTSERWERLWNKNNEAVSKQEVDQYKANYVAAAARVVASQKNLDRLIFQQQFKYIYAPFEGVITQRNVDIGSLIYGSVNGVLQELFQIAEVSTLRFFVDVPQTYFTLIKEGVKTRVDVQEFPQKVFDGVVTRFAKALDPNARTLLTEVVVENKEGILYPGVFANATFILEQPVANFIIPTTSLIIRESTPKVAVLDDNNKVTLKEVKIGLDYGKNVQIVDGLKENDRIITIPAGNIYNGTKVEIVNLNE